MKRALPLSVAAGVLALIGATHSDAQSNQQPSKQQKQQNAAVANAPTCATPLGTVSIVNGDDSRGWAQNNLAPPEKLLRVLVQRSGCFNIVDRGAGLNAATRERDLNSDLGLQRGSNVGAGQVRAADYVLVAEVAAQDADTGGGAAAGAIGGLFGRRIAGLTSGIKTRRLEAQTVLSLSSVRTTETVAVTEGHAAKTDVSFGAGGFAGFGGLVGGGYESTDIGRIVTMAFIDAYAKLVNEVSGKQGVVAAVEAPQRAYVVNRPLNLRQGPDANAPLVRNLQPGMKVYPTGAKQGLWWEVADENDNTGWVMNTGLQPAG